MNRHASIRALHSVKSDRVSYEHDDQRPRLGLTQWLGSARQAHVACRPMS